RCGKPAHNPMTSSANFFVRFFSSWLISAQFEIRTSAVAIATPKTRALPGREGGEDRHSKFDVRTSSTARKRKFDIRNSTFGLRHGVTPVRSKTGRGELGPADFFQILTSVVDDS